MNPLDLLDKRFFGASVARWLLALATLAAIYVALSVARRLGSKWLAARAARTEAKWDDLVSDLLLRTQWYFLLLFAAGVAARVVPLRRAPAALLRDVFIVGLLLQLGVWANGIIAFVAERYTRQRAANDLAARATIHAAGVAARVVVWTLLLVLGLGTFDVDTKALLTTLGVGGIAIALAAQNVLGDLFAAIAIVIDRPFVVGDSVTVGDGISGDIEHVGLKTTRIRSVGGEQIVLANSELLKSRIHNFGRLRERRSVFNLDVTHDTPADTVARIPGMVRAIIEAQPKTRFDRCHFLTFTESALRLETVYHVLDNDYKRFADTQQAINVEILRRFRTEKIEFAVPSRTVIMKRESLPPGVPGAPTS